MNFVVLEPPAKVFSSKFGCAIPTYVRFLHPAKVFSAKWSLLLDPQKFSPSKVSRYTVVDLALYNDKHGISLYSSYVRVC